MTDLHRKDTPDSRRDEGAEWPGMWTAARAGGEIQRDQPPVDAARLRRQLEDSIPDAEEEPLVRPAMARLVQDQGDLLIELLEGFGDRRELLEWQQRVVIHTLGQLEDEWFAEIACNAAAISRLLGREWGPADAPEAYVARETRRGLAANSLLPAFHGALETFRWAAVERVDHLDDEHDGDAPEPITPERQEYPGMRPELGQLAEQQERTLVAFLDGFDSEDELLVWSQQLQGSTYAEISAHAAAEPYFERPLRQYLVRTEADARARFVRRSWAAEFLLPAFNRAADALADRAAEVTAAEVPERSGGSSSIS
jgi:hypothetical protein